MKEKYIVVNGNKIRYLEEGNEKNILVLLHGLGGMAERWIPVFPFLSRKYRLIVPDIIGYGKSDKPQVNYTLDFFTKFAFDFLDALSLSKVFMIGTSLGGQIVAECAATQNQLIKKIVMVAPAGIMKKSTPVLDAYTTAALYPTHDSVKTAYQMMMGQNKEVREESIQNFISSMSQPNAKMAFMSTLLGLRDAPLITEKLQFIKIPALLIWGDRDKMIPFEYSKKFAASIKNCEFVTMKGHGHTPYDENPSGFSKIVLDFLCK
jgi:2-hydroxy-6-oxonona-2,4-dienedioate hydrolase